MPVVYRPGIERDWRLHSGERHKLEQVVRYHVTQRTSHIKISAALFHSHSLGHCDLDVVHKAMVPHWLKDAITEAKHQNVLYSFFPQIMVNSENLIFGEDFFDLLVQLFGRLEIVTKRFFKDNPAPVAGLLNSQIGCPELFHDVPKKHRAGRQIEEVVAVSVVLLINFGKLLGKLDVGLLLMEFARDVVQPIQKPVPQIRVNFIGGKFHELFAQRFSELFNTEIITGNSDDGKVRRKHVVGGQIVESGKQLAGSQVTGGAEDHHGAGAGLARRLFRHKQCQLFQVSFKLRHRLSP